MTELAPEPVRLVIWDLDETFWDGTLTEGGIRYNRANHDAVIELARRGIVSSICSKNNFDDVRAVLEREGIWDYFVFPSINWEPKGPRLAGIIEQIQLRAPTCLFIDDNPMNLGEAQHYVPGLQTADEHFVPQILTSPLFKGKDDSALKRLKQYQLLQARQAEEKSFGADNTEFLRASGLTVTIEHDLSAHMDRAIELINRTNQLNFTKQRLAEDPVQAEAELKTLLSGFEVQAGILRVRDRYGDYGYCGLYIMKTGGGWKRLLHFAFSCRILNMGVETWLYQRLGRPQLKVVGEVLTDVQRDKRRIDWITVAVPDAIPHGAASPPALDYFYARGGCDLTAVSHYFNMLAKTLHGEHNFVRDGANLRLEHSMFARYGLQGISPEGKHALQSFGFLAGDFGSVIPTLPKDGQGVWLLSFWTDADYAVYRHKKTGVMAPLALPGGVVTNLRDLIALDDAESGADPAFLKTLREEFEFAGRIPDEELKTNIRLLLSNAPKSARVFILQANELIPRGDKPGVTALNKKHLNALVAGIAAEFPGVELLAIRDFVEKDSEVISVNHFDRMVYFRVFKHITKSIAQIEPSAVRTA